MTKEEAEIFADKMSYNEAVYYALQAKCVPYKKATRIKLYRLLKLMEEHANVVDKQQVINAIENTDIQISSDEWDELMDAVNSVSFALSEEETGEWIECENGMYKCSICNGKHVDPETGEWEELFDYKYPFCPNCGARLR